MDLPGYGFNQREKRRWEEEEKRVGKGQWAMGNGLLLHAGDLWVKTRTRNQGFGSFLSSSYRHLISHRYTLPWLLLTPPNLPLFCHLCVICYIYSTWIGILLILVSDLLDVVGKKMTCLTKYIFHPDWVTRGKGDTSTLLADCWIGVGFRLRGANI